MTKYVVVGYNRKDVEPGRIEAWNAKHPDLPADESRTCSVCQDPMVIGTTQLAFKRHAPEDIRALCNRCVEQIGTAEATV